MCLSRGNCPNSMALHTTVMSLLNENSLTPLHEECMHNTFHDWHRRCSCSFYSLRRVYIWSVPSHSSTLTAWSSQRWIFETNTILRTFSVVGGYPRNSAKKFRQQNVLQRRGSAQKSFAKKEVFSVRKHDV